MRRDTDNLMVEWNIHLSPCKDCHIEGSSLNPFGKNVKEELVTLPGYDKANLAEFILDAIREKLELAHKERRKKQRL